MFWSNNRQLCVSMIQKDWDEKKVINLLQIHMIKNLQNQLFIIYLTKDTFYKDKNRRHALMDSWHMRKFLQGTMEHCSCQ